VAKYAGLMAVFTGLVIYLKNLRKAFIIYPKKKRVF
jgi:hypothetical protein